MPYEPLSVIDLFSLGVGPSSSHTVGPMRAASGFVRALQKHGYFADVAGVNVRLYGSLALTGKGHATDRAVIAGLSGAVPETVTVTDIEQWVERVERRQELLLGGQRIISFAEGKTLHFCSDTFLPAHPNALTLDALNGAGQVLYTQTVYSIGGGFIHIDGETQKDSIAVVALPLSFTSSRELLSHCATYECSIADVMWRNEAVWRDEAATRELIDRIDTAMMDCIDRGIATEGILPGGLQVRRRAAKMSQQLQQQEIRDGADPLMALDWVSAWALAVNEENAAGGRVVTAPTNGAAGVIPAVLKYYKTYCHARNKRYSTISYAVHDFFLAAAAIGMLYKYNASISAAEMGCQGEVGVACSMAAGALTMVLGGTPMQVENAAEIAMEHNLGMTCDPVKGLVQIPCIERNTMGAVKAINAARLALRGDGRHVVSLDQVIETMRQTSLDMNNKYKETSQGGLAVNVTEC